MSMPTGSRVFLAFGEAVAKFVDRLASPGRRERSRIQEEPLPQEAKACSAIHDIVGEWEVTAMIQSAYQEASAC